MVEEADMFVDNLKAMAGTWGSVYPLLPTVVDLTFDMIGRNVL